MPRLNSEDCSHSGAHKEVISGQRTGEYVCDACGVSWMSRADLKHAQAAFAQRHAAKTSAQPIRIISVSANGKNYEIRVYSNGADYRVAGYSGGRQVTVSYGVTMATDFDFRAYHGEWAHDHLVAAVKDDITQGRVAS